ncbi:hypothetical protein QTO34_001077 [Cnephaeus nilssonii]|uniref:Uncharacterized protein n=1 Tax=Cnephaeus nilssonii TaxID=3371016 RepID=A0AA40HVD9_CNENI|nr:hypothetical protein QTO34_001077 [Eptesicus nilssonii]
MSSSSTARNDRCRKKQSSSESLLIMIGLTIIACFAVIASAKRVSTSLS